MNLKIAPSILSANFLNLENEIRKIEKAGADIIHLDVMDGHFVPNLTFGPELVSQIKKITNLPLDVHLMISNPKFFIPKFIEAGADFISFHIETDSEYEKLLSEIQQTKIKAGIAINPETDIRSIKKILNFVNFILIMTVHPGFGGQKFISECVHKIRKVCEFRAKKNIEIEVDGGINFQTAKIAKDAGANILVAGNFIFKQKNYSKVIKGLRDV